jgi:putative nucleotidyltransferase with HDIG domain
MSSEIASGSSSPGVISESAPSSPTPSAEHEPRVSLLITAVAMTASTALALLAPTTIASIDDKPLAAANMLVLTLVLQLFSVEIYGRGSIGVSALGLLATGYLLGPGPAMAIAAFAAICQWIRSRGVLHRAVFDAANFALAAATAAGAYHAIVTVGHGTFARLVAATIAGGTYGLVNLGLLCFAMSLAESVSPKVVWKERFHWARFHFVAYGPLALASALAYEKLGSVGLLAFALPPALLVFSVRQYVERTRQAVGEVRQANDELRRANDELVAMAERVRKVHRDTIAALSRSMEAKDYYTGGHTERVAEIAVALGRRLGYSGAELEAIEIGALLHDIGKIGIPERVLNKPGPLDSDEWAVMHEHPVISEQILAEIDLHPTVREIARWSHERMDGKGYPDGLAGDHIPLPARITLVADAFDALTSDRPYRRGRSIDAALEELRANSGTQFCPRVILALEDIRQEEPERLATEALSRVKLVAVAGAA